MAGLDDAGSMADFVERHGLDGFPHAYDPDGSIWQRFGTISRSAFVFVDDDGSISKTEYGSVDAAELEERIDELLAT